MDLNHLDFFRAVAYTQNITKAAEQLSVSQPALSRAILKLEEQLGFPLFDRRGKGIYLNRCGRIFLKYTERALSDLARGQKAVHDLLDPNQGTIFLGFIHSLGISLLPHILKEFLEKSPHVDFKLYQSNATILFQQLLDGTSDLAICMQGSAHKEVAWEPLFTENLFIAVPPQHHWAKRQEVPLSELADEPFISFKSDFGMRILTDEIFFNNTGCVPKIIFEGEDIITVAGLVEVGLGISLLPRISETIGKNLVYIPVSGTVCQREIGIAHVPYRYLPPVAKNFKNYLLSVYAGKNL